MSKQTICIVLILDETHAKSEQEAIDHHEGRINKLKSLEIHDYFKDLSPDHENPYRDFQHEHEIFIEIWSSNAGENGNVELIKNLYPTGVFKDYVNKKYKQQEIKSKARQTEKKTRAAMNETKNEETNDEESEGTYYDLPDVSLLKNVKYFPRIVDSVVCSNKIQLTWAQKDKNLTIQEFILTDLNIPKLLSHCEDVTCSRPPGFTEPYKNYRTMLMFHQTITSDLQWCPDHVCQWNKFSESIIINRKHSSIIFVLMILSCAIIATVVYSKRDSLRLKLIPELNKSKLSHIKTTREELVQGRHSRIYSMFKNFGPTISIQSFLEIYSIFFGRKLF